MGMMKIMINMKVLILSTGMIEKYDRDDNPSFLFKFWNQMRAGEGKLKFRGIHVHLSVCLLKNQAKGKKLGEPRDEPQDELQLYLMQQLQRNTVFQGEGGGAQWTKKGLYVGITIFSI